MYTFVRQRNRTHFYVASRRAINSDLYELHPGWGPTVALIKNENKQTNKKTQYFFKFPPIPQMKWDDPDTNILLMLLRL